jgi:hypothetical protein
VPSSLLQQLENNEAVLLMYLAGELPPDDRAEVELLLAGDAALRAEFERLRGAYDAFGSGMRVLDSATRLPVPEATSVRRVGAAMRQWHAARQARPPARPRLPELRYPWWAYPAAAAASVVIAFLVWWGNSDRPERVVYHAPVFVTDYDQPAGPQFDAEDVAAWWGVRSADGAEGSDADGGANEAPEDLAAFALIDPSDSNVLLLVEGMDDEPAGPEWTVDEDEIYLQ